MKITQNNAVRRVSCARLGRRRRMQRLLRSAPKHRLPMTKVSMAQWLESWTPSHEVCGSDLCCGKNISTASALWALTRLRMRTSHFYSGRREDSEWGAENRTRSIGAVKNWNAPPFSSPSLPTRFESNGEQKWVVVKLNTNARWVNESWFLTHQI